MSFFPYILPPFYFGPELDSIIFINEVVTDVGSAVNSNPCAVDEKELPSLPLNDQEFPSLPWNENELLFVPMREEDIFPTQTASEDCLETVCSFFLLNKTFHSLKNGVCVYIYSFSLFYEVGIYFNCILNIGFTNWSLSFFYL